MNRWETAPADGGISREAQEEEARERMAEIERDRYLRLMAARVRQERDRVLGILRTDGSKRDLQTAVDTALWWALRFGVSAAESGQHAEWILETDK